MHWDDQGCLRPQAWNFLRDFGGVGVWCLFLHRRKIAFLVTESATGVVQAETTFQILYTWELTDKNKSLVFDTTASNSGVHKGAAKLLEDKLQRKIFFLARRDHISEIVIVGV